MMLTGVCAWATKGSQTNKAQRRTETILYRLRKWFIFVPQYTGLNEKKIYLSAYAAKNNGWQNMPAANS
jgi:hypothetical protein